jgi:hypothetical protein
MKGCAEGLRLLLLLLLVRVLLLQDCCPLHGALADRPAARLSCWRLAQVLLAQHC